MKRGFQSVLLLIIIGSIVASGCSNGLEAQNTDLDEKMAALEKNNEEYKKEISKLEKERDRFLQEKEEERKKKNDLLKINKSLEEELDDLRMESVSLTNKISIQEKALNSLSEDNFFNDNYLVLPVYWLDIITWEGEKEVQFYNIIPKKASLEDKITAIADKLSSLCYGNLPIELVKIDDVKGKKIAIINLEEYPENYDSKVEVMKGIYPAWNTLYFQGSSGGAQTTVKLTETFLQRDYQGQWIDGVKFLYNNEDVLFQHVPSLEHIHYR